MTGLVEELARRWDVTICPRNVIVEGTTDVRLLEFTARLYRKKNGVDLLGRDLAILPAGIGEEGGVNGLNSRLKTFREIAAVDLDEQGRQRFFFCGLYDNDRAGKEAVRAAQQFDSRLQLCRDLFLLHPVMSLSGGAAPKAVAARFLRDNAAFSQLNWELEDLLSDGLLRAFEHEFPDDIRNRQNIGGKTHRDYSRDGKHRLHKFIMQHATIDDVGDVITLIRALRDYLRLRIDHIIT